MKDPETVFTTQVVSDVERDGLGVELLAKSGEVFAEVFRCDRDRTVIVNTFGYDIPIHAMQRLFELANVKLDPFDDGTSLDESVVARSSRES